MDRITFLLWNISILLESLPVSSSGHLQLITKQFFKEYSLDKETEQLFHIPNAIIIILLLSTTGLPYFTRLYTTGKLISWIVSLTIANSITGISYLFWKNNKHIPLALGFFISGCTLLSLSLVSFGSSQTITPLHAVILGCAQTAALLPGISRLAVTCSCAVWLGIDPFVGFIFSLTCELALMIVAFIVAFSKRPVLTILPQIVSKIVCIALTMSISYGALQLTLKSLLTGSIVFFGWYLIGLSIFTTDFLRRCYRFLPS